MHQGRPIVHGRYSKYKDVIFGERINELLGDTDELLDIGRQIAVISAVQEKFLADLQQTGVVGQKEGDYLIRLSDSIAKNIERVKKLEGEAELPKDMRTLVTLVVNCVNYAVTDNTDRQRVIEAIGQIPLPAASTAAD